MVRQAVKATLGVKEGVGCVGRGCFGAEGVWTEVAFELKPVSMQRANKKERECLASVGR